MKVTNKLLNLSIKLYRKTIKDNVIDKTDYDSLCNIFTKYVDEIKMNLFYKHEYKNKIKLFQL